MAKFTLTMLDTSGIQNYIFGSNRLQENIGASEIVAQVTTRWVLWALTDARLKHNGIIVDGQCLFQERAIEQDESLNVEVIYAGGGNTFLIFRHESQAKAFTRILTRRVLTDAPGLTLVVQHTDIDWEQESLREKRTQLIQTLANHKQARLPSTPLLGLGVTVACDSTGLVAVRTDKEKIEIEGKKVDLRVGGQKEEEPRPISQETACKLGWRDFANERLRQTVGDEIKEAFEFPADIDNLGRIHGEESYVAVIHADGNRMGKHINAVGEKINWEDIGKANRQYVTALRTFSANVEKASLSALRHVIQLINRSLNWDKEKRQWLVADAVPLVNHYLPFRPLVFGGDDVTFLANGQLGLSLATAYLQAFEEQTTANGLPDMHASAGVAIVKTHYPFARAYRLSESLTKNAKQFIRRQGDTEDFSALDWHFALSGLGGSLSAIRRQEYQGEQLLMRPLRLRATAHVQDGRYWLDGIERLVWEFQNGGAWLDRRNKVKGLREPLRAGPEVVKRYRNSYDLPLLPSLLPGDTRHQEEGWTGGHCVYFDAIELMDHYVRLV